MLDARAIWGNITTYSETSQRGRIFANTRKCKMDLAEDDLAALVENIKSAFAHVLKELEENLQHCKTSFDGGEEACKIHSAFKQVIECQGDLRRIVHDMEKILSAEETEEYATVYATVRKQVFETAKEVDAKAAKMLEQMESV